MIPVIIGVTIITFLILKLIPGDPALVMAGEGASPEKIEQIQNQMGLNEPFYVQYFSYLSDLITLDFGKSVRTGQPVMEIIAPRFWITIQLAIYSILFGIVLGVIAGIISAVKQNSFADIGVLVLSVVGLSMPNFWLGLIFIYFFSIQWGILPTGGWGSFQQAILPTIALGTIGAAIIARMTRSSMLEVIRQDYIQTARAKGVKERKIIYKHALRNALIPVITVIGLQFGNFLSGAILTEVVFSINGMGRLIVDAIYSRDFPLVQGTLVIFSVVFIFVNLITDITYQLVNKKIDFK